MKQLIYQVCEHFSSINGEGPSAGFPAVFIRFKGCNLNCSYCDTSWANTEDAPSETMTASDIARLIRESGLTHVTLTGGEPLFRAGMPELIDHLTDAEDLCIEIETNGSMDLSPLLSCRRRPSFIMDYKLPDSGMESAMHLPNLRLLTGADALKFVAGSDKDLVRSLEIIRDYDLGGRTQLFFSPVFGRIDPKNIVDFLIRHQLNDVRLQLQMHKFIWDPMQRGV